MDVNPVPKYKKKQKNEKKTKNFSGDSHKSQAVGGTLETKFKFFPSHRISPPQKKKKKVDN